MAYIDHGFYKDSFRGTAVSEDSFPRLAEIASDTIDAIVTIPVSSLDQNSDAYVKVKRACAYLVESLEINGGIDAITGFSASSASSESLGDYSISSGGSSSESAGATLWYGDIRIPQLAYALLRAAGLISRWAYAGTVIDDGY